MEGERGGERERGGEGLIPGLSSQKASNQMPHIFSLEVFVAMQPLHPQEFMFAESKDCSSLELIQEFMEESIKGLQSDRQTP